MRTSLAAASIGAAVVALATGISPSNAQSAAQLYPYCAFRSGSTSCYHLTLESCGRSCIRNPGYVGDERAGALRAALGAPAPAGDRVRTPSKANRSRHAGTAAKLTLTARARIEPGARVTSGASN